MRPTTIRLPAELDEKLIKLAAEEDRSLNNLIIRLLQWAVEHR